MGRKGDLKGKGREVSKRVKEEGEKGGFGWKGGGREMGKGGVVYRGGGKGGEGRGLLQLDN